MKKTVLVAMVLLLAVMVAAPVSAQRVRMGRSGGRVIEGPGYVISTTGGPSVTMGRPGYGYNRGYDNRGGYGYDYDYGYDRGGNRDRTNVSVGLGGRIAGIRVNLGYNKTTYSRPKPVTVPVENAQPVNATPPAPNSTTPIAVTPQPTTPVTTDKYRLTLVREVGDQLEPISDIIVTNPEKELVPGKRIVFNRAGEFFAEYEVSRVNSEGVLVNVIDAPRGNPQQGDGFCIEDPPNPINVVD